MDLNQKISRRPDLVAVEMDGSTVMMDVISGKYFRLSGVGGTIWELLEQETTLDVLIEKLCSEYAVSEDECRSQTIAFVAQLSEQGLLVLG